MNENSEMYKRINERAKTMNININNIIKQYPNIKALRNDDNKFPLTCLELDEIARILKVTFYWINTGEKEPTELKVSPCSYLKSSQQNQSTNY